MGISEDITEYKRTDEALNLARQKLSLLNAVTFEDIQAAFHAHPDLPNLLNDEHLGQAVLSKQEDLRAVVALAVKLGLPIPGLMASLAYFDAYRSAVLPLNLIQAQRDYFGSHTYERTDMPGKVFHTEWSKM